MRKSKTLDDAVKEYKNLDKMLREQSKLTEAESLLMLLNSPGGTRHLMTGIPFTEESRKRFTDFVIAVKGTVSELALMEPFNTSMNPREIIDRCKHSIWALNNVFSEVRLVPLIEVAPSGRSLAVHDTIWIEPAVQLATLAEFDHKASGSNLTYLEVRGVLAVANLLRLGTIDSLRRCECGKWFIASRSDQKSCSSNCRQKKQTLKADFNEKRREWYRVNKERKTMQAKREARRAQKAQ